MNDKKHIDRLFQEKFKNFEATPDDAVWDNIHTALHKDKRQRRVIPIWWWTGGVAAALILLFTLRPMLYHSDPLNNPEHNVVETETTRSGSGFIKSTDTSDEESHPILDHEDHFDGTETTEKSKVAAHNSEEHHNTSIINGQAKKSSSMVKKDDDRDPLDSHLNKSDAKTNAVAHHHKNNANHSESITDPNPINSSKEAKLISDTENQESKIAKHTKQNNITNEKENDPTLIHGNESIEEAIAKAYPTNEDEEEKEEQSNRWNISPNVAPVYFNSMGKGSTIHSQFVNNGKTGEVHMSYGISGSYAINDKIKIRAGVNRVDLGYRTNEVVAFRDVQSFNATSGANTLPNINFKNQGSADVYMSASNIKNKSAPQFLVSNPSGTLEQQFGYIEVPLELEYSLINSRFGFNVIGGFSTLFLSNNEVYSVLENERSLLGDANNINSTSYSANLGLGLNYHISPSLQLNLEPMFKYQINTFNNTSGDFRPYFIGVYSGFSFKF